MVVLMCSRRILIGICVGLIATAFAIRTGFVLSGASSLITFVITPARMDCLAVGALLALLVRGPGDAGWRTTLSRRCFVVLGAALLTLAIPGKGLHWETPLNHTLGLSLVAMFFGAMLMWTYGAHDSSCIRRIFESRFMRTAGKYSYSMYIFHGPAGTLVKVFYDPTTAPLLFGSALPRTLAYGILAGLVTFTVAWITWHALEKRVLSYQKHFR